MANTKEKRIHRKKRHIRVRTKILGTAARPRLCVFRSLKYIYAQIIDDLAGKTLVSVSSLNSEIKGRPGVKIENAKSVGELLGKKAHEQGIKDIVFDRGGYKYHGRIKSLADAAREGGLKF